MKLRDSEEVDRGYWGNQGFLNLGDEITFDDGVWVVEDLREPVIFPPWAAHTGNVSK